MAKVVSFRVPAQEDPPPPYDFPQGFSGGHNISVAPDQIPPNCSPSMENINYDDGGVISKRYGMSRVNALSWGETPIRGIHQFYRIGITEPLFLIFHGGKLYSYDETTDTKTDLCTGSVLSFADNPIPKERVVTVGDKFYFLTGEEFLYYDGVNPVATVQSIALVPVVAQGKSPDGTGGTLREKFNHLSDQWRESFSSNGTATEYVLGIQYMSDGITPITLSTNLFKAYVYGAEKVEGTHFTFNRTTWKATFSSPPIQGTDNVEIQLEAASLMDQTLITKCTMAIEYGGKNDSRVMISGHPNHPNIIRYCAVYDPTYWPEDSDFGVGSNALAVNGWGRMNEYLVTYKQPGDDTAQWYSEVDIDSTGYVSFPTFGLNEEFGCIANRTVHSAQNGLLALSDKGVVWTWPSVVKGQANCKVVSRNVNGRNGIAKGILDNTKADLTNAHAEVYMNKYILFIRDKVWVLDLDYSDLANNIYCWYPYTGIYAKAGNFLIRKDRLYMGDKSIGLLYKSETIGDDYTYTDDGLAITAWWTSPLMFLGGREWEKKFERINMTFKPTFGTGHTLSLISDLGVEDIPLLQTAGFFDARYFHAQYLNAGTENEAYPTTQSEKIGYKGQYIQFRIKNSMLNRGLTMLSSLVSYTIRKAVK
jgi:hypothetical protein